MREFLDDMPTRLDQYEALLDRNEIWLAAHSRAPASSPRSALLELGVTGPLLRATGNPWDLRKAMPYSSYDHFDFKIPVGTVGDNYDRYRVRMAEMRESLQDRRAGARRPARGPVHHRQPQGRAAAAPRAGDLDGGADPPLQARDRGLPRAAGRGLRARSSGRAASWAASCVADGSAKPARVHMRDPSLREPPGAAARWRSDSLIADLIACLAMLDPILGGIDR